MANPKGINQYTKGGDRLSDFRVSNWKTNKPASIKKAQPNDHLAKFRTSAWAGSSPNDLRGIPRLSGLGASKVLGSLSKKRK